MPFTVTTGNDVSNTGGNNDRPNQIGDWHVADPGASRWFNPCTRLANGALRNCQAGDTPAWEIPASGQFGNVGRNSLHGDGLKNFDFGLYRSLRITERQSLQLRAEAFNLTNHPNFYFPNQNASSSAFGTISRAAFQSQTGAQRQIQFALKYLF